MTQAKHEAFLTLLGPVHNRLWRFALAMTRDYDDAEDLVSETILATYERFHTIRDSEAFTSFLFTVATRIHRHKEWRARSRCERASARRIFHQRWKSARAICRSKIGFTDCGLSYRLLP
jgi:DNA-directed RNA polymerase specialized sigma24 family protein